MKLATARNNEVYIARELIDFGDGLEAVRVFYPKNKLITKDLREAAEKEFDQIIELDK